MRTIRKALIVVAATWASGFALVAAEPALAAAKAAVQDVFITNTADNPVAVNGSVTVANPTPIPVNGTVTVANPTPAASQPQLLQKSFEAQPITADHPFASGILYRVPAGKVLTVEFFQAHWLFSGIGLRQADIRAGCLGDGHDVNVDQQQVFFPDEAAGVGYHVVGGPVTLRVAAGNCLSYEVGANYADFPPDQSLTLFMYGGFSGYLTDAVAG